MQRSKSSTSQDKGGAAPLASSEASSVIVASPSSVESTFNSTNPSQSKVTAPADFGIIVATRVRPFNRKELGEHSAALKLESKEATEAPTPVTEVEMDGKTVTLIDPKDLSNNRGSFSFDYVFSPFAPCIQIDCGKKKRSSSVSGTAAMSPDPSVTVGSPATPATADAPPADSDSESDDEPEELLAERAQADVYRCLGAPIVKSAWEGYNTCIFAYGQTSSGKTYTMMGTKRDPGVIPRLCKDLFERIEADEAQQQHRQRSTAASEPSRRLVKVTVSYMEIYNEQARDLLKPRAKGPVKPKFNVGPGGGSGDPADEYQSLKVRQHPLHGPFVEGLTTVDVVSWLDCVRIIRQGNDVRSHCSTEMNESSSRSHAIFQIVLTQTEALGARVRGKDVTNHKVSKINLVDLAGSERILRTNVTGKHLTEAQSINQSLSTLRRVIDILVQKKKGGASQANVVVPYRESMLTWILSDNFGGNSKTVMCANVSPHSSNILETESTLRYATLARGIVNRVRVNEDPSAKLIRELQNQLKILQEEMQRGPQQTGRVEELIDEINANKRAMEELSTKEEGMKRLITESRAREEKLMSDVQSHQEGEERWRREAEKLRREKEELRRALKDIARTNPELFVQTKEANFWNLDLDERTASGHGADGRQTDFVGDNLQNDDSTVCPMPAGRRKSSMRKRSTAAGSPLAARGIKAGQGPSAQSGVPTNVLTALATAVVPPAAVIPTFLSTEESASPLLQPSSSTTPPVRGSPPLSSTAASGVGGHKRTEIPLSTSSSVSDGPRFGRRAATEEKDRRDPLNGGIGSVDSERPMSEQYLQNLNSRLASGGVGQPSRAGVPLSLQHLVGLTPIVTTNANVFGRPIAANSRDTLGSPLSTSSSPQPCDPSNTSLAATDTSMGSTGGSGMGSRGQQATQKQRQAPDALDAFLEGGDTGTVATRGNQRGVPPWRKPAKK